MFEDSTADKERGIEAAMLYINDLVRNEDIDAFVKAIEVAVDNDNKFNFYLLRAVAAVAALLPADEQMLQPIKALQINHDLDECVFAIRDAVASSERKSDFLRTLAITAAAGVQSSNDQATKI